MADINQTPKSGVEHIGAIDDGNDGKSHDDPNIALAGLTLNSAHGKAVERKLLRKLDARMSLLVLIYILNYIDRSNAAAARLKGFQSDLGVDDVGFATIMSILFAGFILFQVPSNIILNRTGRPSLYLTACMFIWGLVSTLTGVVTSFSGAVACRFFIGLLEAAFSPGVFFILSKWYTKKELSLRIAIFYCGNLTANAFGNLIAAGILANMEGDLGHRAWRWLFYIEGAITMAVAIIAAFILPDFPHNSQRHFTDEEIKIAQMRLLEDVGEVDLDSEDEKWYHGAKLAFTGWRVYILAISQTTMTAGTSFSTYFPSLTKTLGYDATKTLLLSAPPWVFACIVALVNTWHSDRVQERYFHHAWPLAAGMVGFVMAMATKPTNIGARYTSLFLMTTSYAGYIIVFPWISSSFPRPPGKRAVVISFVNAISQLGAVGGSYVWPSNFGPSFIKSFGFTTAMYGTTILLNFVFRQCLVYENKKIARGETAAFEEHGDLAANAESLEQATKKDVSELKSGFRYML